MSKRILVHADDLAMCHGANVAFQELTASGFLDGGSIMVPCPWFKEIATMALENEALDVGVHLTLNSEKEYYKWGPLTKPSKAAGLVDGDGFLWKTVAELRANCHPEAAEAEMRAQIDAALAFGIDVTHADAHMFAALAPEFVDAYLSVARDYRIPVMFAEEGPSMQRHLRGAAEGPYRAAVAAARELGIEIFDSLIETAWQRDGTAWDTCQAMFEGVGDGLTYFALHPTAPGELEFIEPRTVHIRTGEYDTFSDPEFLGWLDTLDFERVTWREMRTELRSRL